MNAQLDLVAIGRVSVDLYGQQTGSRLEEVATFAKAELGYRNLQRLQSESLQ
jgi:hypothetical protein